MKTTNNAKITNLVELTKVLFVKERGQSQKASATLQQIFEKLILRSGEV